MFLIIFNHFHTINVYFLYKNSGFILTDQTHHNSGITPVQFQYNSGTTPVQPIARQVGKMYSDGQYFD